MIEIKEILNADEKSNICNDTLRTLPNWFGVEASIVEYVEQVKGMPFYAAFDFYKPIGFVAIKVHNPYTAEVCVMGVIKEYHRQGIGKMLMKCCDEYCTDNGIEFLTVKTLAESRESKSYEKTRLFYQSVGFKPLEVFPLLWDKDNPCLFMAKSFVTMNGKVNKLIGSNMDIDFSNADFGNSQCPWNIADKTNEHKCAVINTSICKYFCGIQYLDSVFCSYPHENLSVLTRNEIDRDIKRL